MRRTTIGGVAVVVALGAAGLAASPAAWSAGPKAPAYDTTTLAGKVAWQDADHFNFRIAGAPPLRPRRDTRADHALAFVCPVDHRGAHCRVGADRMDASIVGGPAAGPVMRQEQGTMHNALRIRHSSLGMSRV